jgi:hypothetical protein
MMGNFEYSALSGTRDISFNIKLTTKVMFCSDFIPKPPPIVVNPISNVADIYTVSKLLGHASVKTTEKYYVDLVDDNYKSALNGLDKII